MQNVRRECGVVTLSKNLVVVGSDDGSDDDYFYKLHQI